MFELNTHKPVIICSALNDLEIILCEHNKNIKGLNNIFLFGSMALKTNTDTSDIDVFYIDVFNLSKNIIYKRYDNYSKQIDFNIIPLDLLYSINERVFWPYRIMESSLIYDVNYDPSIIEYINNLKQYFSSKQEIDARLSRLRGIASLIYNIWQQIPGCFRQLRNYIMAEICQLAILYCHEKECGTPFVDLISPSSCVSCAEVISFSSIFYSDKYQNHKMPQSYAWKVLSKIIWFERNSLNSIIPGWNNEAFYYLLNINNYSLLNLENTLHCSTIANKIKYLCYELENIFKIE